MKAILRKLFLGNEPACEYKTLTTDTVEEQAFLHTGNRPPTDVSSRQFLLCLEPVVLGIWITDSESMRELNKDTNDIKLAYCINESIPSTIVTLQAMESIAAPGGQLFLFTVTGTLLQQLPAWQIRFLYNRYYKKPSWPFNRYSALIAAYSYPRKVRLVSFKEGACFNIFPMDLLGDISNDGYFFFGLRNTNTTLEKIMLHKKIVVAEIPASQKDMIYRLGKHHSDAPPSVSLLPFPTITTEQYGFYLPEWVESYKEIIIMQTINLGSHRLLWGKISNEKKLLPSTGGLFHLHFFSWLLLKKNKISYQPV